jgi:hypothetical protein
MAGGVAERVGAMWPGDVDMAIQGEGSAMERRGIEHQGMAFRGMGGG